MSKGTASQVSEKNESAPKRIALAYSGGLDTSIIIPWLKENFVGSEVIAVCADIGQREDFETVKKKAIASGATKVIVHDLKKRFVEEFLWPLVKSGSIYEGKYLLGTSIARPLIAEALVESALKEHCEAISHGATGKGNDQVRFEVSVKALAPHLKIIAPWRIWNIRSREEACDYADQHGIPIPVTKARPYSMDENLWHLSHEGAELENPSNAAPDDVLMWTKSPQNIKEDAETVEIEFKAGIPTAVNGKSMDAVSLVSRLNDIGARHGIGVVDMVENRLVGMKSRGVYETPGGTLITQAHAELERLTLDRSTHHYKEVVALKYGDLVYDGLWFTPLREAIQSFIDKTQETVTGKVKLKLYRGNVMVGGAESPFSLYHAGFATFGEDEVYKQSDAEGFINLFGLSTKIRALMLQNQKKNQ